MALTKVQAGGINLADTFAFTGTVSGADSSLISSTTADNTANVSMTVGGYDNFNPANAMVIPSLVRKAQENEVLEVWGDGTPIRDFIHAKDVALGMLHMVKNKITKPVNLGSGTGISIKQIACEIADVFNKEIKWLTDAPSGDPRRVFDMARANSYGFKPTVTIKEGIQSTINWFLKNKDIIDKRYNVFDK